VTSNIPSEIILGWAKDIASGMNMVHSAGIVHRDLKTYSNFFFFFFLFFFFNCATKSKLSFNKNKTRSNILLEVENNRMNAIICDFGLARISSEKNVYLFIYLFY